MKLLKKKLVTVGKSRSIIIPVDFIKLQNPDDNYFVVYVPDEQERKGIRA